MTLKSTETYQDPMLLQIHLSISVQCYIRVIFYFTKCKNNSKKTVCSYFIPSISSQFTTKTYYTPFLLQNNLLCSLTVKYIR
jgi:hypothetical protein